MEEEGMFEDVDSPDHQIQTDLNNILEGKPVEVKKIDVGLDKIGSYVPVTKKTVCYIVAAVLVNEANQVLMIQEANYSCYGTWYLPAGRVERGELLIDACKREVEEEAGLTCEPTTLIAIEYGSGCWYRFTFTAKVTGGKLKTLENKDKESLQAEWIAYKHIKEKRVLLRANDVIPLIKIGFRYRDCTPRHNICLPIDQGHTHLLNRPVIVQRFEESRFFVLACTEDGYHLPVGCDTQAHFSAMISAYEILKEAMGKVTIKPRLCGSLGIEHSAKKGTKHDGLCLTTLISLDESSLPVLSNSKYQWVPIKNSNLIENMKNLFEDGRILPFVDLHG